MLAGQLEELRAARLTDRLLVDELYQTALAVAQAELAHELLANDGLDPPDAFRLGTRLTADERDALASALEVAHVPLPLSRFTRARDKLVCTW